MENEEILQRLSKVEEKQAIIERKLDKVLNFVYVIAKTLHVVTVTEDEERKIQLLQRKNVAVVRKVQEELTVLEEKPKNPDTHNLTIGDLYNASTADIYGDIIGSDFIPDAKEE